MSDSNETGSVKPVTADGAAPAQPEPSIAPPAATVEVKPVEPNAAPEPPKPAESPAPAAAPKIDPPQDSSRFWRRVGGASVAPSAPPSTPKEPPAPKKPRRDGTLSLMSGFLSFLLVVMVAGVFGGIAALHKLKEPGPLEADKVVYISPRSDPPEILAQLEREGVIDQPRLLYFALMAEGKRGSLKQGEYEFKKNASLRDVIDTLSSGHQLMHSVTIPEGLTSEQIVERLKEVDLLAGEVAETPKEGTLLPETYKFPRGFPRARLLAKMQDDQRKVLNAIWTKRAPDLPLKTPYELVTLASIVEKETGKVEERPKVAAVFINRLRKHMRLQSDPTIVYGLVGGKATLGHSILRSEIDRWTPYNTYQIDGLPPGPIANPGRAALEATAHPAKIDSLYFVADGTGGHTFTGSLGEHSRAVQNWRKIEKDKKDSVDRAAPDAPAPPPPPPAKLDKRTEAPVGRMINLFAMGEDYSPGRAMSENDGATHRLGKFSPDDALFFIGGDGDPTALNAREYAELRPARPFFTQDEAQPRMAAGFDPNAVVAAPADSARAAEPGADDPLNPGVTHEMARESADGRALPDDDATATIAAYPVSAARRAEQKARAARLGLPSGDDKLPAEALGEKVAAETAPPAGAAALAAPTQPTRPRAFDASEGTALDPLRDKSWDLTSAKTVPAASSIR